MIQVTLCIKAQNENKTKTATRMDEHVLLLKMKMKIKKRVKKCILTPADNIKIKIPYSKKKNKLRLPSRSARVSVGAMLEPMRMYVQKCCFFSSKFSLLVLHYSFSFKMLLFPFVLVL